MRFLIKFIVGFEKERYTIGELEKYIEIKKVVGYLLLESLYVS